MDTVLYQVLSFLPWCWVVNMSFDILVYASRRSRRIASCNVPLDGGRMMADGNRVLGDSTTWLGLLQATLLGFVGELLWPGRLLMFLALLVWIGHLTGSFIKRRFGIARGRYLPIIDHGDYSLLTGGILYVLGYISFIAWVAGVLVTLLLTPLVTYGAYKAGIRVRPL